MQHLLPGDLLFSNLSCDEGLAIQTSTKSPFTHIGMVHIKDHKHYIIEAHGFVKLTPLSFWIDNCHNKIAVGRVLREYASIAEVASCKALAFLGRPYNDYYEFTDQKLYCSSLIYYSFKLANQDEDFFPLKPMNFTDAIDMWKEYFGARKIPQGEPGLSPATIYNSPKIKIIYDYRFA